MIWLHSPEDKLGKGVVWAKDTPNFIANRIGSFAGNYINQLIDEMDLSFEEADALTGPVIGHPKMATYKLADLVGLDTMSHVADNVYDGAPDDEKRDVFKATEWITKMVEGKMLGMKTKGGFYKKAKVDGKKVNLVLDRKTMEYREPVKPEFEGLTAAKGAKGLAREDEDPVLRHRQGRRVQLQVPERNSDLLRQPHPRDIRRRGQHRQRHEVGLQTGRPVPSRPGMPWASKNPWPK